MKAIGLICAAILLSACGGNPAAMTAELVTVPSTTDARQSVFLEPLIVVVSCQGSPTLVTDVTFVVSSGPSTSSIDSVLMHMIDGSNLGGPSVTYPQAGLVGLFGPTSFAGTRRFTFRPRFACGATPPRFMTADVTLVDDTSHVKRVFSLRAGLP
jgi:hypothetical protein